MELWKSLCVDLAGSQTESVARGLRQLNDLLPAMASGLWLVEEESHLELVSYEACEKISQEVQIGFQEATRHVLWQQNQLGIVAACWERVPVVALADPEGDRLRGSASWLVKFGSDYSISCPVIVNNRIVCVLAVAFDQRESPPDKMQLALTQISTAIADLTAC